MIPYADPHKPNLRYDLSHDSLSGSLSVPRSKCVCVQSVAFVARNATQLPSASPSHIYIFSQRTAACTDRQRDVVALSFAADVAIPIQVNARGALE